MIQIYHNPRCSKSREGIKYLEDKGIPFKVIKYLTQSISENELRDLLNLLGYNSPKDLIRTNESIWKEKYSKEDLTDDELIQVMLENPKLIQRPIVINGELAVVARPTEKIDEVL